MIRKAIYLSFLTIAMASCSEDKLDVFNGENYVHFTPGPDDKVTAEYNFAYGKTTAETVADIPVEIRLWGYLPEADFSCSFTGGDDTRVPLGCEIPSTSVFRAGKEVDTLWIRVKRADELLATSYTLKVQLSDAEEHKVAPAKYSAVTVKVTDALPETAPAWWNTTQALGGYSPMKYRVLNIYLGHVLTSLDGYTVMGFASEAAAFKSWWKERWDEGMYRYYDKTTGQPLYETIP